MDKQFVDGLRKKLQQEKDGITKQLQQATHATSFDKDRVQTKWENLGDKDEDNAMEVADYQDNVALERNLEISLEKIDRALARMDAGTYGQCEQCGGLIEEERLLAYPEAVMCMQCTGKKEA